MPWNNPAVTNYSFEPFENLTAVDDSLIDKEIPVVLDRREGCLVCHSDVKGFSPAHNPEAIGCFSCHGGNLFSLDEDLAHKNMLLMPGALSDAKISRGTSQSHPGIPDGPGKIFIDIRGLFAVQTFLITKLNFALRVKRFEFTAENVKIFLELKLFCQL